MHLPRRQPSLTRFGVDSWIREGSSEPAGGGEREKRSRRLRARRLRVPPDPEGRRGQSSREGEEKPSSPLDCRGREEAPLLLLLRLDHGALSAARHLCPATPADVPHRHAEGAAEAAATAATTPAAAAPPTSEAGERGLGRADLALPLHAHQPHPPPGLVDYQHVDLRVDGHCHHHGQLRRHGTRQQATEGGQDCTLHSDGERTSHLVDKPTQSHFQVRPPTTPSIIWKLCTKISNFLLPPLLPLRLVLFPLDMLSFLPACSSPLFLQG